MEFLIRFAVSFAAVALIYAFLAAFTSVFYKNKSLDQLSINEMDVLSGEATLFQRLSVFIINLFSSIVSPPVYILALVIGGVTTIFL